MTNEEKPALTREDSSTRGRSERAQREEKILQFWKENKIFEKTLEKSAPKGEFVFYDGPPFATGLPHYGSLLSSIIKDVIPRYKTMRGFRVRRRWGWDCHGLPIENMIEKELGITNKKEIEKMGVAKFNKTCRDSVLRFADEWKIFVDRVGRFVDYDNSYKTMDNSYIESVWWALKAIYEKGLLYEGRKVLLCCPRCETPLAKTEIAMDQSYKDVTEESVYVKFKIKKEKNTYLLVWTTTPWTLPGNVALAVGDKMEYVKIKVGEDFLILAESRLSVINSEYEVAKKVKAKDLVGLEYEPLFEISAAKQSGKKAWYVSSTHFVNTEEGTGVVHIAVIYGEDDYELGLKLDLPMVPLLDLSGHFNTQSPEFIQGEYFKKAEKAIKEDLEKRNLLFKREMHTHSYPYCHRCGTALLYSALSSWFINIQEKKGRMIALNENINWIPGHLKHGRFLNNIENAPDWTISRNRYWASPLPIWKDSEGGVCIIGSLEELKQRSKTNKNKFIFIRHGEAESNVKDLVNCDPSAPFHLTEKGRQEIREAAKKIEKADVIYTSPYLRAKESAEIVADELKFEHKEIREDKRLSELNFGDLDDKSFSSYLDYEEKNIQTYDTPLPNGESYQDAKKRFGEFLYDIDSKHKEKAIIVVTHGIGLETMAAIIEGADLERSKEIIDTYAPEPGKCIKFDFTPIPHNENYELDLHRPYIDQIELVSEDGKLLKRIPEVIDGWVESGSMPFAEYHYPFENKEKFKKHFPGDFIAEYIAQTRTWFYYMHVVASLLFDNISFRNVVTTGTILAEDGGKMSKSKGNYTDPMDNFDRFSADALRYYLMSSVVMRAEDIRFSDDELRQIQNQLINILWNTFKFYELYADEKVSIDFRRSDNVLDKWILARLRELGEVITFGLENYDTVKATRPIKDFVSDFSIWYIRRSRNRFKSDDTIDSTFATATAKHVFLELSKLIAPVMPFIAEDVYLKLRSENDPESVHLCSWPEDRKSLSSLFKSSDKKILKNMEETRRLVSLALEARSMANIKVRQPLGELRIKNKKLGKEFLELIRDELNVKRITVDENIASEVELDTNLTLELIEEGKVRDAIRAIQDMRKEKGLKPGEKMSYAVPTQEKELFVKHSVEIKKATNIEF